MCFPSNTSLTRTKYNVSKNGELPVWASRTLVPHFGIRLEYQRLAGNLFFFVHPSFLLVQCPVSGEIIHEALNRVDKSYPFPLKIPSGFKSLPGCFREPVFYGSSLVGFEVFAYQICFSASSS